MLSQKTAGHDRGVESRRLTWGGVCLSVIPAPGPAGCRVLRAAGPRRRGAPPNRGSTSKAPFDAAARARMMRWPRAGMPVVRESAVRAHRAVIAEIKSPGRLRRCLMADRYQPRALPVRWPYCGQTKDQSQGQGQTPKTSESQVTACPARDRAGQAVTCDRAGRHRRASETRTR